MRTDGKRNTLVVNLFGGPGTGKSAPPVGSGTRIHSMQTDLVTEVSSDGSYVFLSL